MSEAVPSWARVGAKVVCVQSVIYQEAYSPLVRGAVYTVAAIIEPIEAARWDGNVDASPAFVLAEVDNPYSYTNAYDIRRFRPLVSQEDDIATHFQQLLDIKHPELIQ